MRKSLEFFRDAKALDPETGKLRETFSAAGSSAIRERDIDNGHPYWCMQAFAFFRLPADDPFCTAPEEPLPVERHDYQLRFPVLGMTVLGTKSSGQVRWLESRNLHKTPYRDKYIKFSYSSHFPFNVFDDKKLCPWDQTLVFRDPHSGVTAGRSAVRRGELLGDGSLLIEWSAFLGECTFEIATRIRPSGEFEERTHIITAPPLAAESGIQILEGSYSLGLDQKEPEQRSGDNRQWLRNPANGSAVFSARLYGYNTIELSRSFGQDGETSSNILSPRIALNTLRAAVRDERTTLVSLHYASPRPATLEEILEIRLKAANPS